VLRLAVFDLDGTLKREKDPYMYLHSHLGTAEAAEQWVAPGLSGEIPYEEWLRLDVSLWRGIPRSRIEQVLRENPYLPGARETVAAMKERGVRVAIISTGLLLHAQIVAHDLGISPVYANEIMFERDGAEAVVSGQTRAHVTLGEKGRLMENLQSELGVRAEQCLAVGDGSSDIPLFERAGVSVALNPSSPEVATAADIVLPDQDMRPLLDRLHEYAPHLWPAT
jgi:phosphoserine phosphatase